MALRSLAGNANNSLDIVRIYSLSHICNEGSRLPAGLPILVETLARDKHHVNKHQGEQDEHAAIERIHGVPYTTKRPQL